MMCIIWTLVLLVAIIPRPGGGTVVDLTHTYGPDVLYPPIGPGGTADMFNFTIMHRGYEPSLDAWLEINWFGVFEHGSTHVDAPAHYAQGRAHLHEIPVEQLIGPGVMIDITDKAKHDKDYLLTIQDILAWEEDHAQIPQASIVMLNTGKHKLYPNRKLFYGTETPDDMTTYHNPGVNPDTAKWLIQNRQVKAFGTDAHSCDPGQNSNRNRCHEEFLPNGVILLEFVANLDRMPPVNSTIFLGPMKMRDGSGGPCRILAIYGEDIAGVSAGNAMSFSILLSTSALVLNLLL
ncbi:isatin hydrolase-like [Mya arenaria]|uniref:isatin hydrolase-like n=1 Tax=Mya arenaria TaxID=6604 RepID=UPI0022DEB022|nr:isatin hydrolase-like [Mya arenaria]